MKTDFEYGFEKLRIYQLIRALRVELKKMTLNLPDHERYELCASNISFNLWYGLYYCRRLW